MPPEPPVAPLPISANLNPGRTVLTVFFDQPLVPGLVNAGNWSAVWDTLNRTISTASVSGNKVTMPALPGGFNPVADNCSYSGAAPVFVTSLASGLPAAPFTGFPIT